MDEYIKRGEAIKAIDHEVSLDGLYANIRAVPAADVRPERHGEWLVSGECYECSECGGGSIVNTNPYCWKCGAKMDGKDGESDG
ncbi:MAG: hypothetical protein K2O14_10845 [Oscillospiraceae bacterium]|nr:hypothetical protein [Oscillospiraceae bacterium]